MEEGVPCMENKEGFSTVELFPGEIQRKEPSSDEQQEVNAGISGRPRMQVIDRKQMILKPIDVDNLVEKDHEVRAIWELVGRLDLSAYYDDIEAVEGKAGRPAIDPQLLISIWIYAYSKGISSAREICRLCEYDPAYQWLTGMEEINYHTLSDFRVYHGEALHGLFVEVLGVLSSEGLVTFERVMHDGTKIKAYASTDSFRTEGRIRAHLEAAREQVQLMKENAEQEVSPRVESRRERVVRERKERLELALDELEKIRESKKSQKEKAGARVSMSDPESRNMKQSDGGFAPSFNVQISTDSKNKVIVGVDVSQSGCDYGELVPAVDRIKENMGHFPEQMVVDGGFISTENVLAMEEKKVDLIGPVYNGAAESDAQMHKKGVDLVFRPDAFRFDGETNTYICPNGKVLRYEGEEKQKGHTRYRYRACTIDCKACQFKQQCCPQNQTKGRSIVRGVIEPVVVAFKTRMKTDEVKAIYKQRAAVAEFPNAWIKEKIRLRQFRLQGLLKVGIEALWACITYNIQQWIRLCWRSQQVLCSR
jgi:transposase